VRITEKKRKGTKRTLHGPTHWAELCLRDGDRSRSEREIGFPIVGAVRCSTIWRDRRSTMGLLPLGCDEGLLIWSWSTCWIKVVVLRFLLCEDEDLCVACLHWSGQSVEFRKTPPANSTGRVLPRDCWLRWDSVVRTHVFFLTVWFQRERGEALLSVAIKWHVLRSMMKSEAESLLYVRVFVAMRNLLYVLCQSQKPSFWGLASEVRVFVEMRNLLYVLWLVAAASTSRGDNGFS
jgi:hypothetical protein